MSEQSEQTGFSQFIAIINSLQAKAIEVDTLENHLRFSLMISTVLRCINSAGNDQEKRKQAYVCLEEYTKNINDEKIQRQIDELIRKKEEDFVNKSENFIRLIAEEFTRRVIEKLEDLKPIIKESLGELKESIISEIKKSLNSWWRYLFEKFFTFKGAFVSMALLIPITISLLLVTGFEINDKTILEHLMPYFESLIPKY